MTAKPALTGLHSKALVAFILVALSGPVPATLTAAPPFECFATSDLVRAFEDQPLAVPERLNSLQLFGLRDETISGQCVVVAHEDLTDLTVSVGPLELVEGAGSIAADRIGWNFVGSIYIRENTPKLRKQDLTRSAPAWFPDYLADERLRAVKKGAQEAVYLTIHIPENSAPGQYRGAVIISADGSKASVPLTLTVYPLRLPDKRHVMVTEWFSTSQFSKQHGVDPGDEARFFDLLKVYAENMAAHRQNVFRLDLGLIQSRRGPNGELRFDFARFDRWANLFWDTRRMDLLETGFVARFAQGGWSSTNIVLRDFTIQDEATGRRSTMAGSDFLPQFLPGFVRHLRANGWLEKTVFHICDEPSNHNVLTWREASAFVHRYAPELRRIDAIETPHCQGELEIWVPKLDHLATWQEAFENARRQGNEIWLYTVGIFQGGSLPNKTADVPLIESRLLHWLNYRYDLKGYLHWGFNAWTDDPIQEPGQHRGDGWHVYPKRQGLLDSLRWEQMRNGLQDYECLWLLEDAIGRLKSKLSPRVAALIDARRRGVEIATGVVASYDDYSKDPGVLYAARRQAIEETLALEQSPRVLLETCPSEHSPVARDCAIDVHGWAEPGTTLKLNGQAVPAAEDGLFLAQAQPSREYRIVLQAEKGGEKKVLVRQFRPAEPSLARLRSAAP